MPSCRPATRSACCMRCRRPARRSGLAPAMRCIGSSRNASHRRSCVLSRPWRRSRAGMADAAWQRRQPAPPASRERRFIAMQSAARRRGFQCRHEQGPAPALHLPRLADDRARTRRGWRLPAAPRPRDRRRLRPAEGHRRLVGAHSGTRTHCARSDEHEAVYDFGNFDPRLFSLRYDAPGAPQLAARLNGAASIKAGSITASGRR